MRKLYCIFILGILGCTQQIELESFGNEEVLVIDGSLTNLPGQHYVRLSRSIPLDGEGSLPISGAQVWIIEDGSNRIDLNETDSGEYVTDAGFRGTVGSAYQLFVQIDEEEYVSAVEPMPKPAQIDSIYGRVETIQDTDNAGFKTGVQFFVDSSDPDEAFSNFRFEYIEDYQIDMPYFSTLIDDPVLGLIPREQQIRTCYNRISSDELLVATTSGQSENRLSEFPLVLVEAFEPKLITRYSLTVRQHTISSAAFNFYRKLKENNESAGGFFDEQKGTIKGNIQNVNNPEETVLGYFEVAGITETFRIFEPEPFSDQGFNPSGFFDNCLYNEVADSVLTFEVIANIVDIGSRNINQQSMDGVWLILVPRSCSDCRLFGELEKPEFWD
jgi:hypothetical protein